ncbi:hypothetical protein BDY21DRAFT_99632 [Lineolata rhizophorae]|uniref:BZIP transcription factor n=1 Tax=Lineolata rhizophorae TaxID=578093 RepID=A0A6A6NSY5_9PEZI|nr:hypothetical protein BDY21DRAFT_99632 [Lineolata rhizophorae]
MAAIQSHSVAEPSPASAPPPDSDDLAAVTSSSQSESSGDDDKQDGSKLQRPKLGSRKSSGTIIIPRDSPMVEVGEDEEEYDENDARTMSPRRSSEEIERMGREAREALMEASTCPSCGRLTSFDRQAKALQASLLDIVDRVETVKSEHEKLEGGNRFLQSYIGELMQTSKITSSGAPKLKGKGRAAK